jgi:hypothetical protein
VVANIQQIVGVRDRWLNRFAPDFFDLVLIDEGHHNPAASWRKVLDKFAGAKVVSLTATPFRSDSKDLIGELVYRYAFARAMERGYIKHLRALTVAPTQLYFTTRDDTRIYSLEEVMHLREETWFRRGLALAPKCNWDIVRASVQKWLELRKVRGTPHQIIAATCSIDHAQQVQELYAKIGLRVRQLHSQLAGADRRRALTELRDGKLDCIVQVEMLGEGFDHPPLSVAAIFRPFASLAPYVQFVGRIMRVLREGDIEDPDNHGWVVSHAGLHVDRHWDDFHQLDVADQEFFTKLLQGRYSARAQQPSRRRKRRRRQSVASLPAQLPLPTTDLHSLHAGGFESAEMGSSPVIVRISRKNFSAPLPTAASQPEALDDAHLLAEAAPAASDGPVQSVGPQQRRRQLQAALRLACKGAVNELLQGLKLRPSGWQLYRCVPGVGAGSNYVTLHKILHRRVNSRLGIKAGERKHLPVEQTEQALIALAELVSNLAQELNTRMGNES